MGRSLKNPCKVTHFCLGSRKPLCVCAGVRVGWDWLGSWHWLPCWDRPSGGSFLFSVFAPDSVNSRVCYSGSPNKIRNHQLGKHFPRCVRCVCVGGGVTQNTNSGGVGVLDPLMSGGPGPTCGWGSSWICSLGGGSWSTVGWGPRTSVVSCVTSVRVLDPLLRWDAGTTV